MGPNYFDKNTGFFWKFEWGASGKLPFKFGVIGTAPLPGSHNILWIDDENGKTPIRLLGGPAQIVLKGLIYQQKKILWHYSWQKYKIRNNSDLEIIHRIKIIPKPVLYK